MNNEFLTARLSPEYQGKLAELIERLQPRNRTMLVEQLIDEAYLRYVVRAATRAALTPDCVPPKEA